MSSVSALRSVSRGVSEDKEVERISSKYSSMNTMVSSSSPLGPSTVFLSKKMKELTEKQRPETSVRQSSVESRHSPVTTHSRSETRLETRSTKSFLEELSNKRMTDGGVNSPTDSFIDRMIISAQQDIVTPTDQFSSRQSSILNINNKLRDDYNTSQSHRLHLTDNMKTFESKYLESRARSPVRDYHSSLYNTGSPMKTYSQVHTSF